MPRLTDEFTPSDMFFRMLRKMDSVPMYPSPEYLRRNWAPETVSRKDVAALVDAERRARKGGVMSNRLADKFFANMLTEGRPAQFGVRDFEYPPTPERDARIRAMGLKLSTDMPPPEPPPDNISSDADLARWEAEQARKGVVYPDVYPVEGKKYNIDDYWAMDNDDYSRKVFSRMGAVTLGEKERQYGTDKALERWNGRGTGVAYGGYVSPGAKGPQQYDARNHARKVDTLARMLTHPANRELYNWYLYNALQE